MARDPEFAKFLRRMAEEETARPDAANLAHAMYLVDVDRSTTSCADWNRAGSAVHAHYMGQAMQIAQHLTELGYEVTPARGPDSG